MKRIATNINLIKRRIHRFKIYDSDVFIVSYPRSGNTWLRYLITNIIHHDKEIDYNLVNKTVIDFYKNRNFLFEETPVRYIKSHETYTKRYPKVIYIYRDGRDVAGSYYRFCVNNSAYKKPFDFFLKKMLNGDLPFGAWQIHIKSWLFRKYEIPFFPIKYEDLLENTELIVKQLCEFIDVNTDLDIINKAIIHSSIRIQHKQYMKSKFAKFRELPEIMNKQFKWIKYFDEDLQNHFFYKAGDVMLKLGYEIYDFKK